MKVACEIGSSVNNIASYIITEHSNPIVTPCNPFFSFCTLIIVINVSKFVKQ